MVIDHSDWHLPAAYVKLIVQAAEESGVAPETLLDHTALRAETLSTSDRPATFADTLQVLRNAERRFGPGWHLEVGRRLSVPAHGPLGFAVVTAPTLRAALDVVLRYMGTRAPFLWSSATIEDDRFVFRFFDTVDMGDQRQTLIELAALSLQGLIERPLGREIRGARLAFAYEEPCYGNALAQAFHADLTFGAERHSLSLPAAWLDSPCALFDEAMHRYLLARCEEELAETAAGLPAGIAVRQAMLAAPGALPSLAEVAARKHVSPRTLIRRLKQEGTSYRALREEVRRTLARDLLRNTALPVSRIAWRLGYQDPSNFSRAWRRWFGCSPVEFREEALGARAGTGGG